MKHRLWRFLVTDSLWRDMLLALLLAVLAGMLAATVELNEWLFAATRRWEPYQLDEWPAALLVFACCMVVLYARRHRQLQRVLGENRRLVGRILEVQEQERRRLARELHDELGQYLNAIKLDALTLPATAPLQDAVAETAHRIAANADHVYSAASDLVRRLRPPALDELGLVAALEACVARWGRSHPDLQVQLSAGGDLDDLGETLNLSIYRIVQEALTNCVRHAQASHLYIDLTRVREPEDGLLLEIRDDGSGFIPGVRPGGSGLTGMRERVGLLGGQFELLSQPGQGVTIRVEIALQGVG